LAIWERTQILATLQRIANMMDATEIEATTLFRSEFSNTIAGRTPRTSNSLTLESLPIHPED
jgi:hypothetical protein